MRRKPWIVFLSFFITLNTLFFYGFVRDGTWLVIALLLIPLYFRIGYINFFVVSLSFLLTTLVLLAVFKWGFEDKTYSRAQQMLLTSNAEGHLIYKKNKTVNKMYHHGDLKLMADKDDNFKIQPHLVKFKVDSLGFRNNSDYNREKYILLGDSFIAGTNTSQGDILSSQLKEKYGVNVYNLAVSGNDFPGYIYNVRKFEQKYGGDFKILLFLFEGNDFNRVKKLSPYIPIRGFKRLYKKYLRIYKKKFKETSLYHYTFTAYKSLIQKKEKQGEATDRVTAIKVKNYKIATFNDYLSVTRRETYPYPEDGFEQHIRFIEKYISAIIFIPTKYRVYYDLMESRPALPLPNVQWKHLQSIAEKSNIRTVNLTEPLTRESRRLLAEKNELTYWTDDTHWNANGIAVAARAICEAIKELGCSPAQTP